MISDFFQLTESAYEYKDMEAVKSVDKLIAPNGNIVVRKHSITDFTDAYKWNSTQGGDSAYEKDSDGINYILAKTGLELQYVEIDK